MMSRFLSPSKIFLMIKGLFKTKENVAIAGTLVLVTLAAGLYLHAKDCNKRIGTLEIVALIFVAIFIALTYFSVTKHDCSCSSEEIILNTPIQADANGPAPVRFTESATLLSGNSQIYYV